MKLSATEDIRAPLDAVWTEIADIDRFEAMLAGRADDLQRRPPGPAAEGTRWEGRARIMGKSRDFGGRLVAMDAPRRLSFEGDAEGMEITIDATLEELGPELTRLSVVTEAAARTLSARLLLQTAKLGRAQLADRYADRVSTFADRIGTGPVA